jgi:hypothetical protein
LKVENDFKITQISNPTYSKLSEAKINNTPVVIQDFVENPQINIQLLKNNKIKVPITNNTTYLDNDLKKQDIDILVNSFLNDKEGFYNLDISNTDVITKKYKTYLNTLLSPITIHKSISLNMIPINFKRGLGRSYKNLNLYIVESGEIMFQLFHPKYETFLTKKKYMHSNIEGWNISETNIDIKPKYVDIIIRQGQGIIIPFKWIYNYSTIKKSIVLNFSSLDFFSPLIFPIEKLKYSLK